MNYEIRIIGEEDTIKSKVYDNLETAIAIAEHIYNDFMDLDFGDEIVVAEEKSKGKDYFWANGKVIINKIQVGDAVVIRDSGKTYSTYYDFMVENATPLECCFWGYGKAPEETQDVYEVIHIAPHSARPTEGDLAIIRSKGSMYGKVYIIHIDGLKKV